MADAEQVALDFFTSIGLPNLTNWYITQRNLGAEPLTLVQEARKTPEYKQVFGVIDRIRQTGAPVPTEGQVLQYRQMIAQGPARRLPNGMLADQQTLDDLMVKNVSVDEVNSRVDKVENIAYSQPPAVRAAFSNMFGAEGIQALSAFILDPDRAQPILEKNITAAEIKGFGDISNIGINNDRAIALADQGVAGDKAQQAFQGLAENSRLFEQTAGENTSVSSGEEGVNAIFGLDSTSSKTLDTRKNQRKAAFDNSGQAAMTNTGVIGLGEAK